jgi:tetratricopeptide (TPR) repeat protein
MTAKPLAGRSFLVTFALLLLSIAGIFAADTFLAKTDRAESHIEAERLFAQGRELMKEGKSSEAVERINDAIAIERDNRDYQRRLAEAQYESGKYSDADSTLSELLSGDSTDGLANLTMARVQIKEGRMTEAISYFHRAIYGHWQKDAEGNRRGARLELIDLLAQQNAKEELLAELLPLEEDTPPDAEMRMHLGELFLQAGSPGRAAGIFREILHQMPDNAKAYSAMGQAEFAEGGYRTAQRDFQAALRITPDDAKDRHWLELCDQLLQLDPTLRGLGPEERMRRSIELVTLAESDVGQCLHQDPSPELKNLLDKGAAAEKAHVKTAAAQSEAAEENLDLAEQLWQARKKECQATPPTQSPLALVLARLAR